MKIKAFIIFMTMTTCAFAAGGSCKKCEALRKYHEGHPCEYEYYEDYLKAMEEGKDKKPQDDKDFPKEFFNIEESEEN